MYSSGETFLHREPLTKPSHTKEKLSPSGLASMENLEPQQDLEDTQRFRLRDLDASRASQQYCQGKMSTDQEVKKELRPGSKSARLDESILKRKCVWQLRVRKQILQGRKPLLMCSLMWYHLRWLKFSLHLSPSSFILKMPVSYFYYYY